MTVDNTKTCNYCGHNFWALEKCPKCRDQFAAAAPIALEWSDPKHFDYDAELRYKWADAMMEARDK